jgi:hypothetical protein
MNDITILQQTRSILLNAVAGLSEEQLLFIPEGFRNNILWNLGHVIVTQQLLNYGSSGNEMYVSDDMVSLYRRGTSPAEWGSTPQVADLLTLIKTLPEKLEEDYKAGLFTHYNDFTTSLGVRIGSIEDAISYNNFHEGLHMGVMVSMKKLIMLASN